MKKLLLLLGVIALAGAAASPAHAHHRVDNIVYGADGKLQPDAKTILNDPVTPVPHHLMTQIWTTAEIHINGHGTVPAGTQLSKAQFFALSPAQLSSSVQEGMPAGAIKHPAQSRVDSTLKKVRTAGRRLPSMKHVGKVLVPTPAGVAAAVGVHFAITGYGDLYYAIRGDDPAEATMPGTDYVLWCWIGTPTVGVGDSNGCANSASISAGAATVTERFVLLAKRLSDNGTTQDLFCTNAPGTAGCTVAGWWNLQANAITGASDSASTAGNHCGTTYNSNGGACVYGTRTEAQMEAATETERVSQVVYNNTTHKRTTIVYNQPTFTAGDDTAMEDALGAPGAQSDAQKDAEDAIRNKIAPGTVPGTGHDPGTGTGTSPTNPTYVQPPPTTVPPAGGLDFTPITGIDFGCKFPYGLICYAVDVTGWFNVTEDAPRFVFDIPSVTVLGNTYGGGADGWVVDLENMDSYMSILRGLLTVVLWVGAVYWLAASLLGFRAGGDPGEAADEALHV